MVAIKFEKSFVDLGGFWLSYTQKEANAFSLWNNNLGYQGILEFIIIAPWGEVTDNRSQWMDFRSPFVTTTNGLSPFNPSPPVWAWNRNYIWALK
jgi:hypothetical protein